MNRAGPVTLLALLVGKNARTILHEAVRRRIEPEAPSAAPAGPGT